MTDYPEHDKMQKVQPAAQVIGQFMEWLLEGTPYLIAEHDSNGRLEPVAVNFETLLYRYFEIDRDKIDAEKQQMLDDVRAANEGLKPCPQCRMRVGHKMDCSEGR